eukprot:365341-Chlamydomonas_euryale.AAC.4
MVVVWLPGHLGSRCLRRKPSIKLALQVPDAHAHHTFPSTRFARARAAVAATVSGCVAPSAAERATMTRRNSGSAVPGRPASMCVCASSATARSVDGAARPCAASRSFSTCSCSSTAASILWSSEAGVGCESPLGSAESGCGAVRQSPSGNVESGCGRAPAIAKAGCRVGGKCAENTVLCFVWAQTRAVLYAAPACVETTSDAAKPAPLMWHGRINVGSDQRDA